MPHALIVDDDTIASEVLAELVAERRLHDRLRRFACRRRAICWRRMPDVVLLDLRLPDGSGIDLFDDVKQLAPTPRSC